MWSLKSPWILHDLACTNPIYTLEYSLKSLLASRWLVIVWWTTTKNLFLSFHPYRYIRSVEDYEHVYILHTSFAWWKPTSNHVNNCRVYMGLSLHRGHPVKWVNVSIRRTTHLFSVIPANDTKESMFGHRKFSSSAAGIESGTSSTRGQCANQ